MPVYVSLLRAVNVGGHGKLSMKELKALYESLGFSDVATLLQSGNVVFSAKARDEAKLATQIEDAIESKFKMRPMVTLRSPSELRKVISVNPFPAEAKSEPGKVLVTFLSKEPGKEAQSNLAALKGYPEKFSLNGRELYVYFPNGAGRSKLTGAVLDRALSKVPGTARNWNTVTKLYEMAKALEAGK